MSVRFSSWDVTVDIRTGKWFDNTKLTTTNGWKWGFGDWSSVYIGSLSAMLTDQEWIWRVLSDCYKNAFTGSQICWSCPQTLKNLTGRRTRSVPTTSRLNRLQTLPQIGPEPTGIPGVRPGRCPHWGRGWWGRWSRAGGSPLGPCSHIEPSMRPTATPETCFRCWEPSAPGWTSRRCCSRQTDCSRWTDSRRHPPERWTRLTWPPAAGREYGTHLGFVKKQSKQIYNWNHLLAWS